MIVWIIPSVSGLWPELAVPFAPHLSTESPLTCWCRRADAAMIMEMSVCLCLFFIGACVSVCEWVSSCISVCVVHFHCFGSASIRHNFCARYTINAGYILTFFGPICVTTDSISVVLQQRMQLSFISCNQLSEWPCTEYCLLMIRFQKKNRKYLSLPLTRQTMLCHVLGRQ